MADDLGAHDVGCFGSTFHETPNIDRLAARGLRLTQAYAASPLCSPTRSAILTGLYPARTGITSPACHLPAIQLEKRLVEGKQPTVKVLNADSLTRLKSETITMAEVLHDAGYVTAHFGKWHLGHNRPGSDDRYEPRDQGFDTDFPHTPNAAGPGGGYLAPWKFIRDETIRGEEGEHIEDRMSREAARFIKSHAARSDDSQPFYLNYWAYSVHSPWNARRDYIAELEKKVDASKPQHNALYAAMVRSLDDGVGRMLSAVDEAGIADNTIIVFFSDNGGWAYPPKTTDPEGYADIPATSNLPQRSGKASLYDGGTREPCIVAWPKKIKAQSSTDALFSAVDWFPTLCKLCDVPMPNGLKIDGVDQSSMLQGGPQIRDTVFVHFPHGSQAQNASIPGFLPGAWVRKQNWKLIRFFADQADGSDRSELYNLEQDPGESHNLAAEQPAKVSELGLVLDQLLRDTQAVIPKRNPNYDAQATGGSSKPKTDGNKPSTADVADPALQGWRARNSTASVKDGILSVRGQNKQPFLGVGSGMSGPATVNIRVRCASGGDGKIELVAPGSSQPNDKTTPFSVAAGEWQTITISVDEKGPLGILRIYLPAQSQTVEIDSIELIGADKKRSWGF
ncbi:MAG: sulfatase [Pirellulales bacterium]